MNEHDLGVDNIYVNDMSRHQLQCRIYVCVNILYMFDCVVGDCKNYQPEIMLASVPVGKNVCVVR